MLKTLLTFLIFFSITVYADDQFDNYKSEIKKLSTKEQVEAYWVALHDADQQNASGAVKDADSISIVNLYKAVVLIHYHGYPVQAEYGYPAYATPWLVWTHCASAALSQYTFPIILQANELKQVPEERFPTYFVGGFLLQLYGQDMEFDTSFNHNTPSIINATLKLLEEDNHKIKPNKVKALAKEYFAARQAETEQALGQWTFLQHDSDTTFKIVKLKSKGWYITYNESNVLIPIKPENNMKKFSFSDGFGTFNLSLNNSKLEICHADGTVLKVSQ